VNPISAASGGGPQRDGQPYRVMVVDDSAVIRGLLTRALESDPSIQVVASVGDGRMALNTVKRADIEVAVLDIEMPVLDGLTALPQLIAAKPGLKIIMASTLTRRNADISMRALAAGAADYVTKPGSSALTTATDFKRELVAKVKALGQASRQAAGHAPPSRAVAAASQPAPAPRAATSHPFQLRKGMVEPFEVLAIGSSTGGPQALFKLLAGLRGNISCPVFITQHMPPTFTTILAEHITRSTGWTAAEATDREIVQRNRCYVAPGDFHMLIEAGSGGAKILRLSKEPPENFCRPSVDPMLRSLARLYGRRLTCAILTGMGHDGLKGGQAVTEAGGAIIAQDEATSVVWGMPGAVAMAGLCSAVLPVGEIAPYLCKLAMRSAA
jgi:two-component system chemotaxis response regulator CheB